MSQMEEYNANKAQVDGLQRDRRERPKQEPLAYAFRSQGMSNTEGKKSNDGSLGSGYSLLQMHPPPQTNQNHGGAKEVRDEMKSSNQYKTMGGGIRGMEGMKIDMQTQIHHPPHRKQEQEHENRNMKPTYGIPAMKTPRAPRNMPVTRQNSHRKQQTIYHLASSPSLSFDEIMMLQYEH